jgi:hypothetical protein
VSSFSADDGLAGGSPSGDRLSGDQRSADGFEVDALELVLQQGSEAQRAATRQRLADDPLLAIELAEARMLVEEFRTLRTEPSRRYDRLLRQLDARAERSRPAKPGLFGRRWTGPLLAAAAAVLAFVGLRAADPLGCLRTDESLHDPVAVAVPQHSQERPVPELVVPVHIETRDEVLFADAVEAMRRQLDGQASPLLREALEVGLRRDVQLDGWVLPRNALALMRRDHELRGDASVRQQELRRRGGAPDTDLRAQELADRIAAGLMAAFDGAAPAPSLDEVGLGLRALVAAGPGDVARHAALLRGGDWLAQRLPEWSGARLVAALSALVEVAAVTDGHRDALAAHGRRLVDDVLRRDQQNWERSLPELVGNHVAAGVLGEAGRLLARLPGVEVEARRAGLVRQLVLGQLRSRRVPSNERPEVVAALVYGFADLLAEAERDELEHELLRWRPLHLVPDFATAQQQAWGLLPGRLGFTRLQTARRRLAMLPSPAELAELAGLCLCLCTDYAAFPTAAAEAALGD